MQIANAQQVGISGAQASVDWSATSRSGGRAAYQKYRNVRC